MASFNASASSSTSKPSRGCTYDVFLSFRGEDTRYNFVDHLYEALVHKGIQVFKDDVMIRKGKFISQELTKAIEESRFVVVVLSKNYADSSWCLGELVKIMKCQDQMGLMVLPVFYHIEPSDVRKQTGDYATAFQKHEENISREKNEVNDWREALVRVASLSGYHISTVNGGEGSVIKEIVQNITGNMHPRGREDNLIGIESHMDVLSRLLSIQKTKEVHIIGIQGMGGIGKTTIAQALFGRISFKYEGSSFIENVREKSKNDICAIQNNILTDVLGAHLKFTFQDPMDGANTIRERLCNKKVLLVLDDVDDVRQLDLLAASNDWFGAGSRIIITTRDEHVLSDANAKYKPDLLRMDQAVELFSWHAFRKNSPPEGYKELSERAVRYTGRLPLALKVLGSFFRGRKAGVWESALDRLAKIPNREVFETLKLSFDNLNDFEKKILLDIAYCFKDREVEGVTRILDSFDFDPVIGISVLIEKSLIDVSNERIRMHDLIEEMCLQIVRESYTNSRLRNLEEVQEMVVKKEVQEVIEAIVVSQDDSYKQKQGFISDIFKRMNKQGCLRSKVLKRMNNLRLLDVHGKLVSDEPSFLPKNLRWISWDEYPFSSLPVPHASMLVGIVLSRSKIQHLWKGKKIMSNLKFIHLESLHSLKRFPDVSEAPNIERLVLSYCGNLVEVHESVGFLKKLVYLKIFACIKLKRLPSRIEIESLDTLDLKLCTSLKRIPEFSPCVVKLSSLVLDFCDKIRELPSSIRYLSNLSFLQVVNCHNLEIIPSSICELKCLKKICLQYCSKLQKLPEQFRSITNLEELWLTHLKSFSLPENISCLSNLKKLQLDNCTQIHSLHSLPSGLQVLSAVNCTSLRKIEDLSKQYESLYKIDLSGCGKLLEDEHSRSYLDNLSKKLFLKKWASLDRCLCIRMPGSKIPSWFKEQQHGDLISIKLSPNWQTEILGFAVCCVSKESTGSGTEFCFIFENSGMLIRNNITAYARAKNVNVFISYIPLTSFEQMHHDYNDFQNDGWSHMVEGNLVDGFPQELGSHPRLGRLRCGVNVVYKKDVESIQQIKPSVSSYYWNYELVQESSNSFRCYD